jgi:RNA 3'-phosphate cyclase
MITGQPFRITSIRARRSKPGLLRQHLVAVQAAAEISGAMVTDADVGSQSLTFVPKQIKSGKYQFAIGTAGSCTLVLQTILPALLYGDSSLTVTITGGTHNPMSPPVQFLQRAYCRVLASMGRVSRSRSRGRGSILRAAAWWWPRSRRAPRCSLSICYRAGSVWTATPKASWPECR